MVFGGNDMAKWAVVETETSAAGILEQAAKEMANRAETYDKPEGERSMAATVHAFFAVTGIDMTEQQGWQFMELLKMVRSNQGGFRADSFVDGAAYAALAGEAAYRNDEGRE
jgi:queuine/archaeosine tRNA-ribosyltransferase